MSNYGALADTFFSGLSYNELSFDVWDIMSSKPIYEVRYILRGEMFNTAICK